jgi:hypothetical protein
MRRIAIALAITAAALLAPAAAQANHLHVLLLGNGSCVILAQHGKERYVTLPQASFKNTSEPTTTANPHPLHVHVHRARPGEVQTIAVYGSASDPCAASGNYVNGP